MKPFTVIRGGLHPEEPPAKPAKKEKYTAFQLQLMARMRTRLHKQWADHAERYWTGERKKNRRKQADDL